MIEREMMLFTGAEGNAGRAIAHKLLKREARFAVMTHRRANRARFEALGMRAIPGDFDAPETLERALAGIDTAYLVYTRDQELGPRDAAFIAAAEKAGVRRLVMCSAFMSGEDAESQTLRALGVIELAIKGPGMAYSIMRRVA